ncbi:MAG: DUF1127 domain-containing protein [Tabrizicola sp.]
MTRTRPLTAFFPHFPPEHLPVGPSQLMIRADRQRQRAALARLDDRMLRDIGQTRAEADAEARRHD